MISGFISPGAWITVVMLSMVFAMGLSRDNWAMFAEKLHSDLYGCIYLFLYIVASQLLVCWSNLLHVELGTLVGMGLYLPLKLLGCAVYLFIKNLAFSVLDLGWLLYFSWRTPSPGCWRAWWSWGEAWGEDSVVLGWHRNRVCQSCVSHLVLSHPSILVVFCKLC